MPLNPTELSNSIETAFAEAWEAAKGEPLASAGRPDRELLFLGIARGLIRYLEAQEDTLFNSITLEVTPNNPITYPVKSTDLNTQ